MKKNKNTAQLENTSAIKGRSSEAADLERQRLEITKELEKLMKKYARATGDKSFTARKHKVGKAPNDFKVK